MLQRDIMPMPGTWPVVRKESALRHHEFIKKRSGSVPAPQAPISKVSDSDLSDTTITGAYGILNTMPLTTQM